MHQLNLNFLSALLIGVFFSTPAFALDAAEGGVPERVAAQIRTRAKAIGSVRSLVIQQDGQRLVEQYYDGMQPNQKMNIKSASKSLISLLVGIAVDRGVIESVNDPISKYLPEYFKAISNPVKHDITIKDLLTMRSGLETTSFGNYGAWVTSEDWVAYALQQPLVKPPGTDQTYSTGSSHLLSAIITEASGISTLAFANRHLFDPMDIEVGGWTRGPQGYYMGGNNLALSADAMAKLGQMVLNGGTWQGERIVSKAWLAEALQTYSYSNFNPYSYGYLWWNRDVAGYETWFAWGYGGQYLFLIPELDALVVILSALHHGESDGYKKQVFQLLGGLIIPRVLEGV